MGFEMAHTTKRSRYEAPRTVGTTDLVALLGSSGRDDLEPRQMSLLDTGPRDHRSPQAIWYAGDVSLVERPAMAVIGTRKVSEEGRKRATRIARELVEAGIVVVSGLAAGVDFHALTSAIQAGGSVIGVIGTPIDKAYPAQNAALQQEIYSNHLLISQFPIGERTFPSSFPARNRTMAAISDASIIIEASESSGTLHQAAECVRLGRWLVIAQSVVDNPSLEWPSKFRNYEKLIVLTRTDDLIRTVYEARR